MEHDGQGQDKTLAPRHWTWTVVTRRLRLTGWEDPTDKADDPDRRGLEFFLSILTPLAPM
jgi:hypothetical protein